MSLPIIYIASAYSGDIEANVKKTKLYSGHVIQSGGIPLNPILNLHGVLSEETDRKKAIDIDLQLLSMADALWAYGTPSPGMQREILEAKRIGIPVRQFTEGMEEIYDKE